MMFLPIVLIIALVYVIFRDTDRRTYQKNKSEDSSPMDILKQRYAQGTLSHDEFLRMKEELNEKN